jgi:predicted membrane channel-forming protein YqfA (hemolysin III family)
MEMKQKVIRILLIVTALIVIAGVIAYFIFEQTKPWVALFIAFCTGTLVVNLILSIFFISKNFRDKGRR